MTTKTQWWHPCGGPPLDPPDPYPECPDCDNPLTEYEPRQFAKCDCGYEWEADYDEDYESLD